MQQVLANLLSNAIRAISQSNGTRRELGLVVSSDTPGWVELSVHDTGDGIADEHLNWLFEPFLTTKREGMGLPVCRAMVEGHGGSLKAHNDPAGGAVFVVRVPALQ